MTLLLAACEPPAAVTEQSGANDIPPVEIPYQKAVLDNGLTLIVHEDRKTPIVSVNVWYHVGSKDEVPGKTGFAHLFEHLMFQGSEHYNDEFFRPLEQAGATEMNGTTNADRTNYFANVPTPALDRLLWMESDRMGHLLGVVTQERLDEQRDVVKNEKRQRENAPYGKVWERVAKGTYPAGHPYSWTTIGSMADLDAATLDDVKEWFRTHYGAANAVIVIAGDIDFETAKAKVEKYFGAIPAGPPLDKAETWIAPITEPRRERMQDHVPQARIIKVWNLPPLRDPITNQIDLFADVLASGKNSRLYQRLVYEEQIATDVFAGIWSKELGSQLIVWATAQPDGDLEAVEQALDEELENLVSNGPTEEELARSRSKAFAEFLRGVERIGGFGGKSDILAASEVYGGSPEAWQQDIDSLRKATPESVAQAAQTWVGEGYYALEVHPFPKLTAADEDADRSSLPEIGTPPDLKLPEFQRARTEQGLEIILAERHATPLVEFRLLFNAGYATDGAQPGLANLAMNMLDEGTHKRDALQIAAELERLGAALSAGASLDTSMVTLSTVTGLVEPALGILADVLLNASYPADQFERLRKQTLAGIAQEKTSPFSLALRTLPPLLYGSGHPYAAPFTGSGTTDSVTEMKVDDAQAWYRRWLTPDNATLIVVGDITMQELVPMIESSLGAWAAAEQQAEPVTVAAPTPHSEPRIFLLDRPGSTQATVLAGQFAPPPDAEDDITYGALNAVLGGMFTSRINMNLREDKGWSYGARSALIDALGVRPWVAYAQVEIDHAADAMREIRQEINAIDDSNPVTEQELTAAQRNLTLKLPGQHETNQAVAGTIAEVTTYDLPDDYYTTFVSRTNALQPDDISNAARSLLKPDKLTWVIVGDLDQIREQITGLGWAAPITLDAEGRPVDADREE